VGEESGDCGRERLVHTANATAGRKGERDSSLALRRYNQSEKAIIGVKITWRVPGVCIQTPKSMLERK
jgi:hypothetical protein